jgi:serine/threonine-protein kinase
MADPSQVWDGTVASHGAGLPRAFGPYLLFDLIGRGGMAEIFLARIRNELGGARRVVIKEILPELCQDPAFSRMLVREAKLAARLSHQNIVSVIDLGRESNRLFLAMAYVEGYDLNQLLRELSKRRIPLPVSFAIFIIREVLHGLDYAHRAEDEHGTPLGIVHRDVSPSNVLISFEGEVSLCDFGIARAMDMDVCRRPGETPNHEPDESRIQRVRVVGKSAYMAPEHARGSLVDSRSDLFAAGILLWELCAGRRLYRGTDAEMLEQACRGEVPPLPVGALPQPARLQAILDRALAVDPACRYQSASEFLEALDHYAMSAQQMASQLRFASFLTENFAEQIVTLRRLREDAAEQSLHAIDIEVTEVEPVNAVSEPPPAAVPDAGTDAEVQIELDPRDDEVAWDVARRRHGLWPWTLAAATLCAVAAAGWFFLR